MGSRRGVAGGEGRYARYGDCPFDGDFRPAYRFCRVIGCGLIRGGQFFCRPDGFVGERHCWAAFFARYVMHGLPVLQPPALRTVAALSVWGGLRLSGRRGGRLASLVLLSGAIIFADPVAVISQVFGCQHLRLPACYSETSVVSCARAEVPRGLRWLLSNFTYRQALHFCFCLSGGAFHGISVTCAGESFCAGSHL